MEKTFTDSYSDTLNVEVTGGRVYLKASQSSNTPSTIEFEPDEAVRLAEYILRAARRARNEG